MSMTTNQNEKKDATERHEGCGNSAPGRRQAQAAMGEADGLDEFLTSRDTKSGRGYVMPTHERARRRMPLGGLLGELVSRLNNKLEHAQFLASLLSAKI